jgi:hypothetical protein
MRTIPAVPVAAEGEVAATFQHVQANARRGGRILPESVASAARAARLTAREPLGDVGGDPAGLSTAEVDALREFRPLHGRIVRVETEYVA